MEAGSGGADDGGGGAEAVGESAGAAAGSQSDTSGATPSHDPCATSRDCDDGAPCNGLEVCEAGACVATAPLDCGEGRQCSDEDGGACHFTDTSPWIVYQADDDEPSVPELYALKRDLIGKMTPIKLNADLEPGWQARWDDQWSPDRRLLTFGVAMVSPPYRSTIEVVRFDEAGPHWVQRLEGDEVQWAPSGQVLAVREAQGVSIYDYSSAGEVRSVLQVRDADATNVHGYWTKQDEYVFAWTSASTMKAHVQKLTRASGSWLAQGIASNMDMWYFRLSPTGTEIVYAEPGHGRTSAGALYAYDLVAGGLFKLVAAAGSYSFDWSADGSQFLLVKETESGSNKQAFLGTGSVYQNEPIQIAPTSLINSAYFAPDGKRVLIREPVYDRIEDVSLLDPSESTAYIGDSVGRTGYRDGGPVFAADGDLGVLPIRRDEESNVELELFTLSRTRSDRFDSIPPEQHYSSLRFSAHAEFLAYKKGVDESYEGAYVDLRYHNVHTPKPVRLPGEGSVYGLEFDPDGAGLYYILEKSNGARECFYLDLSQQVAQDPVKLSRAGRVDYCRSPQVAR
jgi:hypothetical protein